MDSITYIHEPDRHRVTAYDGDQEIGEATYTGQHNLWILDHTGVNPDYRGRSIARHLVEGVANAARELGAKVIPLCPYAVHQFERNPDKYEDIWQR